MNAPLQDSLSFSLHKYCCGSLIKRLKMIATSHSNYTSALTQLNSNSPCKAGIPGMNPKPLDHKTDNN